MYEMFYVSKNPTEILETTGAIVKALARKKDQEKSRPPWLCPTNCIQERESH